MGSGARKKSAVSNPRPNGASEGVPPAEPTPGQLHFLPVSPREVGLSEPLSRDIELLDRLLAEIVRQQPGPDLIDLGQRLSADEGDPATLSDRFPELQDRNVVLRVLRAFTIYFQLLNTAEQKEIVRVNRTREALSSSGRRSESIAEAVRCLREAGTTPAELQALLDRIHIAPTLTAHPTEARRRAVLNKLHRIAYDLVEHARPAEIPRLDRPLNSAELAVRDLYGTLTALWQTDEIRASQISVDDEVRNGLYFFEHTIIDVVPWLHEDLRKALEIQYPGESFRIPPFVRYRSWVGGDRDGNPNVTPDVTWRTLLAHKELVLRHYLEQVARLQQELTQSSRLVPISEELRASIEHDCENVPLRSTPRKRFSFEPYGLKLLYIRERLEATLRHLEGLSDFRAEGPSFAAAPPAYVRSPELLRDLEIIQRSLREGNGTTLADEGTLASLLIQVRTFGFRLAALDIRQHSDEHARVLEEMLRESGVLPPETPYSSLTEDEKTRLLTRELCNPRPLLPASWTGSEAAQKALQVFEVIRHAQRYISANSVTTYIISMAHGMSDVLEVLLLAKERGLFRWQIRDGEPVALSDLDVVPLFETIDDLHGCDALMRAMFANRAYRAQLQARGMFQEVMLGYSDSSKDGGYLAANWALHSTQARIARICEHAGVTLRLFHGRGGTVGRGGGRANQAILSQPPGSFSGQIRFTEQGEVISFRYGLAPIAHRHLEQIVNAVLLAAAGPGRARPEPRRWTEALRRMAEQSRGVYRSLVHEDPQFWDFYTQATPIAHISRLPIASRPSFRPGKQVVGVDNIRAIPWVFAWVQSRYVLPGWFGLGSALEWLCREEPRGLALLQEMYRKWPFFRTVINNAQLELIRAHLPTAEWYVPRVRPAALGNRIHGIIREEYDRTRAAILQVTGEPELLAGSPVIRRTVTLRNPSVEPLSKLQVWLLESWDRLQPDEDAPEPDPVWREAILLSIIGIAAAMQSTG